VFAPAANVATLVVVIEITLEALEDVIDLGEARTFERLTGVHTAIARPTNQHHWPIDGVATGFFHLADKMRIDVPVRPVIPRNHHRADWMAHKQKLHLTAAIDEYSRRILCQKVVRVVRLEVFHRKSFRNDYNEAPSEDCLQKYAELQSHLRSLKVPLFFAEAR